MYALLESQGAIELAVSSGCKIFANTLWTTLQSTAELEPWVLQVL